MVVVLFVGLKNIGRITVLNGTRVRVVMLLTMVVKSVFLSLNGKLN